MILNVNAPFSIKAGRQHQMLEHITSRIGAHWIVTLGLFLAPVATAQSTPQPPAVAPARVCVIDNSLDMIDRPGRRDGFYRDPNGAWPILSYLLPALNCNRCCSWSQFDAEPRCGRNCNGITSALRELTQTSPLLDTFSSATTWAGDDERIFITNALDWEIRGNDTDYRVEMDIGGHMASWMRRSPNNDILFGVVQDNKGGPRRPVLIVGFVRSASRAEMSFERVIGNLPHHYSVRLARWYNATATIPGGSMTIEPFVHIRKLQTARGRPTAPAIRTVTMEAPFRITPAGRVVIPRALVTAANPGDLEMAIRWTANVPRNVLAAYDFRAVFTPGNSVPAVCIARSGYVECTFALAVDRATAAATLTLEMAPRQPRWLAESIPNQSHAGIKSLATFVKTSAVRPRFTFNIPSQRKMAMQEVLTIDFRQ